MYTLEVIPISWIFVVETLGSDMLPCVHTQLCAQRHHVDIGRHGSVYKVEVGKCGQVVPFLWRAGC